MAIEVEKVVDRSRRICRGGGRRMRRTSQKWYNMQYINMSGNLPMGIAANPARVRCSATSPTRRERSVKGGFFVMGSNAIAITSTTGAAGRYSLMCCQNGHYSEK